MGESARRDGASVSIPGSGVDGDPSRARRVARRAPVKLPPLAPIAVRPESAAPTAIPSFAKGATTGRRPGVAPDRRHGDAPLEVDRRPPQRRRLRLLREVRRRPPRQGLGRVRLPLRHRERLDDGRRPGRGHDPVAGAEARRAREDRPTTATTTSASASCWSATSRRGPGRAPRQYAALLRLTRWLMARYDIARRRASCATATRRPPRAPAATSPGRATSATSSRRRPRRRRGRRAGDAGRRARRRTRVPPPRSRPASRPTPLSRHRDQHERGEGEEEVRGVEANVLPVEHVELGPLRRVPGRGPRPPSPAA